MSGFLGHTGAYLNVTWYMDHHSHNISPSSTGVSCGAIVAFDGSVHEIVVAGGIWYTDKVEIYDADDNSWRDGGKNFLNL